MVALFSYEASQPEDLALSEGDVVLVLAQGKCARLGRPTPGQRFYPPRLTPAVSTMS